MAKTHAEKSVLPFHLNFDLDSKLVSHLTLSGLHNNCPSIIAFFAAFRGVLPQHGGRLFRLPGQQTTHYKYSCIHAHNIVFKGQHDNFDYLRPYSQV